MNNYTLYCSEEQTKKALKLGAPIETKGIYPPIVNINNTIYFIPTAEQMCGWLRKQKVFVHIDPCLDVCCNWHISSKGYNEYGYTSNIKVCKSPEEATLAAIDAALEYLSNNKK